MTTVELRRVQAENPITTVPAISTDDLRPDLVERTSIADAPNQLRVADITYVRTSGGWVYAALVLDMFSRRVVGRQLSRSLHTRLALDALNMDIWTGQEKGST